MTERGDTVLIDEILADARKQVERAVKRAERDARKLLDEAQAAADAETAAALAEAGEQAEQISRTTDARIEQERVALRRRSRWQALDAVRDEAERALAALAESSDYPAVLTHLATLALADMAGDAFEIALRPEDATRFGVELPNQIAEAAARRVTVTLAADTLDAAGGLVVRSIDGRQSADQTFEARLRRLWPDLRHEAFETLDA
jgi:V/A-type H+/Na+-transporting ATPase subunit E